MVTDVGSKDSSLVEGATVFAAVEFTSALSLWLRARFTGRTFSQVGVAPVLSRRFYLSAGAIKNLDLAATTDDWNGGSRPLGL